MFRASLKIPRVVVTLLVASFLPMTNVMISPSHASSPTFGSISPATGLTPGGETVTITGTDFAAGATVKFGGVSATGVVVNSDTSITVVTPVGTAGTADILITNADNGVVTGNAAFTYISTIIQAAGVGGSDWTHKCPSVVDTVQTAQPQVFGFTFNAWGQVFSRLVDGGYAAVTSTDDLVGCYANLWDFNLDPVGTNSWQIGSINRDANGYYWRQAEGPVWRLTLADLQLETDNANPYYSRGRLFIFLSAPAVTRAETVDPALVARNQAAAALAGRMIVEAAGRNQIAGNLQSGSTLTAQQLMSAGFNSLTDSSISRVNSDLLLLPISERDISAVTRLANLYSVVDKVSGNQRFFIRDLVQVGLVPALDPASSRIVKALKSLPAAELDSPAKISAVIAATKKEIADRKALLQARLAGKKLPKRP